MEEKFKEKVFWKDGYEGAVMGGIFYRAFDLRQFLNSVELGGEEVVGFRFKGNNVEVLVKVDNPVQGVENPTKK